MIADLTGGDLFEIDTAVPIPRATTTASSRPKTELQENARPALHAYPDSLAGYDTIFLGYPNWWGTMPMPVFTLLEHCDLTGKRIFPFCTNEGSGMGNSEADLRRLCPGAALGPGLSIHGAEAAQSFDKVAAWVRKVI